MPKLPELTQEQKLEIASRLNLALRSTFPKLGINLKSEMANYLGYKSPYFSGLTTGKEKISPSFLHTLATKLNINSEWIMTGKGSMLLNDTVQSRNVVPDKFMVPLVPVYAYGGTLSSFADSTKKSDCERVISPIEGIDMAITVAGDSMSPEYPNGSIILIKRIDTDAFIEWGKAYVLDTRNGLVLKLLAPTGADRVVKCISTNNTELYAPFEVDLNDVYGVYAVKFCMARK